METVMKHFSLEERKAEELEEIAEREGRKDYDLVRDAISQFLSQYEGSSETHHRIPGESIVRPGDEIFHLAFQEMWVEREEGEDFESSSQKPNPLDRGDVVRAIEDSGRHFTYYKFIVMGESFVCQSVVPMTYNLLDQLSTRTEKYRV